VLVRPSIVSFVSSAVVVVVVVGAVYSTIFS